VDSIITRDNKLLTTGVFNPNI